MLAAALALVVAAMVLVRFSWGGRRGVAVAGWAAALAGLALATAAAGAWGMAVAVLIGTAVALAAVGIAGWRSPVRTRRAPHRTAAVTVPTRAGDWARRAAVFLLVVPGGFVAAQVLALGLRSIVRAHGAAAADATVLALAVQPVAWCLLMTAQMTRAGPWQMIAAPLTAAAIGLTMEWAA